ncbi:MAG: outer membrane beta-barrel protein [Bacteroidales bacterium]|nr:outer membrane beta-barrel protein [Bacteroidales bacterium]
MSAFKRPSVLMKPIMIALFTAFILPAALAQDYRYGLYLSPMISWFGTDVDNVSNKGVRAGFGANITAERHLTDNWYFTSGLGFSSVSGRLVNSTSSFFRFPNHTSTIPEGEPVIYKLQYLSIPVGAKIKTTETGYLVYFAEFGLDPKVAVSKRVDIPSIGVDGERASGEIKVLTPDTI